MKIEYIKHGIACRVGDTIFLHEKLKGYPELQSSMIAHENEHSPSLNKRDLLIDLRIRNFKGIRKDYYRFILTHPSSWTEFLPIGIYKDKFLINPILLMFYAVTLIIIGGIGWILLQ